MGEKKCTEGFVIPVWNGILHPKHVKALGKGYTLIVYLWLLDKTTSEDNSEPRVGYVLDGAPITSEMIADELEIDRASISRALTRLEKHGYITRPRHLQGRACEIRITKSKKGTKKKRRSAQAEKSACAELHRSCADLKKSRAKLHRKRADLHGPHKEVDVSETEQRQDRDGGASSSRSLHLPEDTLKSLTEDQTAALQAIEEIAQFPRGKKHDRVNVKMITNLERDFPRIDLARAITRLSRKIDEDPDWAAKKKKWRAVLRTWVEKADLWSQDVKTKKPGPQRSTPQKKTEDPPPEDISPEQVAENQRKITELRAFLANKGPKPDWIENAGRVQPGDKT